MGDNLQAFSDEQLTNEEFMCTKIAYKLNLRGPTVYVKTACSIVFGGDPYGMPGTSYRPNARLPQLAEYRCFA